uniref:Potassium channel domain-containing protein n=1 Tax=Chenopodium quinoa TaxID=63459 RepID=A0A803MV50_CHEQI
MEEEEHEHLLPLLRSQVTPPPPLTLSPLPENHEVSLSLTPSEFKDRLIFGSFPSSPRDPSISIQSPSSSTLFDALSLPSSPFPSKTAPAMAVLNSNDQKKEDVLFVLVGFGFIDILLSGMVTYVLDLQENYLLRTVKAGKREDQAKSVLVDVKKGRMRIRMKVALALGVVVMCIGVGVGVMHFVEKLGWVDSLYLSVMSVTTVGYGDRAFTSLSGRCFASIWLLVSTLAVARAFLYLAEARIDKRNRLLAKRVLGQDMTVSQFLAADMDNNGFVRYEPGLLR